MRCTITFLHHHLPAIKWMGDKPGASKVKDAERLGAQISSPQDLMAFYLAKSGQKFTHSPRP